MLRWLAAVLIIGSFSAQLSAQASNGEAPKEAQGASPAAAAPSAKTQFPLDAFREFSAVMVGSLMRGDEGESYIYRSGNLLRNSGPELRNFVITDLTTKESFGIAATGCIHDSHPYVRAAPFSFGGADVTVERTAAGQETLDGHACKIEDVTVTAKRFMSPMKMKIWEAEDLQGFPIKVEFLRGTAHHPEIHYKNVVLGPQDPTLFIYPKKCEKSLGYSAKLPAVPNGGKKPAAKPTAPQN